MFQAVWSESKQNHGSRNASSVRAIQRKAAAPRQALPYGNQAMLRLLESPNKGLVAHAAPRGVLQRKCACGGSGGECAECKEKEGMGLQRSPVSGARAGSQVPSIVHEVLRSAGQPLDRGTRAFFEPRFGQDLSNVRVHTDSRAAESANAVQAQAYTVGRDIVFGANLHRPNTAAGNRLLAHELTHVLQQGREMQGAVSARSIGSPTDAAEREAERIGAASESNSPIAPTQSALPGSLLRLGANPDCSKTEADSIHQGIYDCRGWLNKAIPALEKKPLDAKSVASLRRNFGATYGVEANAQLIHDRLVAARDAVGSMPYSCARAPADAICAAGNCGYTPGAGSHRSTICADVTLLASTSAVFKAGCVLHESFHATFGKMDVDFYSGWHGKSSSTAGYPGAGTDPLLNADSYTTLVMDLS
jgi:hypothetical protein